MNCQVMFSTLLNNIKLFSKVVVPADTVDESSSNSISSLTLGIDSPFLIFVNLVNVKWCLIAV